VRSTPTTTTARPARIRSAALRPFSEGDLDAAGALLAERHRRHRVAEPLLSPRFEDAAAARAEVERLWRKDGAAGAAAVRGDEVVGFLVGAPGDDEVWGPNVWIEAAGHAAAEPELARDLYAAAAAGWVDDGRTRHYAVVPATDGPLVEAWFRLCFGQQQAYGIAEVAPTPWPARVRAAEPRDVDELVALTPLLAAHQLDTPVFSGRGFGLGPDELRAEIEQDLASDRFGDLVAEHDGRIVAFFEVVAAEESSMHVGLAQPERAAYLGFAIVDPAARGSGLGVELTQACFAWAHERAYESMVTDWRVTNLLASRFWPARGFRTSFLRLYRSVP
jgi:ribosomal protein S18 acetylase RimI-like enzyme